MGHGSQELAQRLHLVFSGQFLAQAVFERHVAEMNDGFVRAVFRRKAAESVFDVPAVDFLDPGFLEQFITPPQQLRKAGFVIGLAGQRTRRAAEALLRVMVGKADLAGGVERQNPGIAAVQQPVLIVADALDLLHPLSDLLLERKIEGHEHQGNGHDNE